MSKFTDFAINQDVVSFKDQFDSAIADKVADVLAQKKLEVAQTFFNEPVAAEEPASEVAEEVEQVDEQSPSEIKAKYYHDQFDKVKPVKAYYKEGKLVGHYRSMAHAKQMKPGHTYKMAEEVEQTDEKVLNPYAVGMAQAMKSTGDEPPLKKTTIKKAHEIAKSVAKK